MRIDWMTLAEGLGSDANGALTLIGFNRNVFVSTSLPAVTKRAVLLHVSGDREEFEGREKLQVAFSVTAPSGRVLLAQTAGLTLGASPWIDIPAGLDVPAEFGLNLTEYGDHVIRAELDFEGTQQLSAETILYVRQPPASG